MSRSGWAAFVALSLMWGVPYLFIKIAVHEVSPAFVAWSRVLIAAAVLLPLALRRGALGGVRARLGAVGASASLVMLGVVCTALALVVYFFLVAEAGPSRASVITYVNPAVAVALGVAILGESLTFATGAELLLIVAGSWLSTDGRPPPGLAALARWAAARAGRPAPRAARSVGLGC